MRTAPIAIDHGTPQTPTIADLRHAIATLTSLVVDLGRFFAPPMIATRNGTPIGYRHHPSHRDELLLSYLKCVRATSTLNASLLLLEHGYVQEVGALCRCIDEFNEDVMFLARPLGENGVATDHQIRMVEEFYQEEFMDVNDPVGSSKERHRVPRKKVHSGIARLSGTAGEQSQATDVHKTIMRTLSGFTHGAYVHIMELFGGTPPRFHLTGMKGTPRHAEWIEGLANYVYRSLMAVEIVAARTLASRPGDTAAADLKAHISATRRDFARFVTS